MEGQVELQGFERWRAASRFDVCWRVRRQEVVKAELLRR